MSFATCSVAGFTILLSVCAVSGQQYPNLQQKGSPDDQGIAIGVLSGGQQYSNLRLKGTPGEPSIAIGVVSGGKYPAGSFSIGYGDNNGNGDGGPGGEWNVGNNVPVQPTHNGGNRPTYPNTEYNGQEQNGGGFVNGQNDIGSYGGQNNANQYGRPVQNPGQKPPNPYDDDYNKQNTNKVPVRNSAPRINLFSGFIRYILSWF